MLNNFRIFAKTNLKTMAYYIVQIKGEIWNVSAKTQLKVGDKVEQKQQIRFGSPEAMAVVMSVEKGRYIISGQECKTKNKGELLSIIDSILTPEKNLKMSSK